MSAPNCRRWGILACVVGLLLAAEPARCRGDLFPFTFVPGGPTVTDINGTLTYDVASGHFQDTSTASTLNASYILPRGFAPITSGVVTVDLFVNQNGQFVSGGTGFTLLGSVTINGNLISGLTAADPLLQGSITNFGADLPGPPTRSFNGLFTVRGGELTKAGTGPSGSPAFALGSLGGFLLSAENVTSGILGNFTQSFSSSSVKSTDGSAMVPEPGPLTLALLALALTGRWGWVRGRWARSGPRGAAGD
jgi:hypothetical protein